MYTHSFATETQLEDESAFLQLGQTTESTFYGLSFKEPQPTKWNKFPTLEHPNNKMKYADVEICLELNKTIWSR